MLVAFLSDGQGTSSGVIRCSEFHITRPLRDIARDFPVDENRVYRRHESEDRDHRVPQRFAFGPHNGRQYGNDSRSEEPRLNSSHT